mgnify:CR=1 FL=1
MPLDTVRALALDDGGRDYADERAVSQLRHLVVQQRRTNQSMEAHILDLDRKIALLVKNKIGIEDIVKARTERGWLGAGASAAHAHVLAEANDPFAAHVLTPDAQRRLEAYQALFYVLQTQPTYLARLLVLTNAADVPEHERGQLEQTVLAQRSQELLHVARRHPQVGGAAHEPLEHGLGLLRPARLGQALRRGERH